MSTFFQNSARTVNNFLSKIRYKKTKFCFEVTESEVGTLQHKKWAKT